MSVRDRIRRAAPRVRSLLTAPAAAPGVDERLILLSARQACWQLEQRARIGSLADVEFRAFSQWGEDGILEWLIQRIGDLPRTFVEFGVDDYRESNTRFLLQNRGWRGLVMDSAAANIERIRSEDLYWRHDLTALRAFITRDNVNDLLARHGFDEELGVLSVDIDGNDYWVLQAIGARAAILVCEYNAVFGDRHAITVPYAERFARLDAHPSGQYFGASLGAIQRAAEAKGYVFVGTNSNGVNAFFVRGDIAERVLPHLDEARAWPASHRDARDAEGRLIFAAGAARARLIADMPVERVEDGVVVSLGSLGELYSPAWAVMGR